MSIWIFFPELFNLLHECYFDEYLTISLKDLNIEALHNDSNDSKPEILTKSNWFFFKSTTWVQEGHKNSISLMTNLTKSYVASVSEGGND